MKRFSEQFHKKAQTVKLKKAEQADLRDRIVSYMEYHPLPAEMRQEKSATKRKVATGPTLVAEPFAAYQVPFANIFKFGGAMAAIVLLVVPFVAERAIPGDTLYAVKVNFNEEVRSSLTWDPYEKVEWETVRLNRRIAEAKLLQKEGRLTEEAEAEVAAAVRHHADNAKAEIETLRVSDADEAAIAAIELDSTLTLQAQALAVVSENEAATSTDNGTDLIASAIDDSLEKPVDLATTSLPALPKLTARVEQHTTRVRELEQNLAGQVDAAAMADVTRRIEDLERLAARALALPEEEVAEAQLMLVDVVARAQTLIVFMTELEVRETVAIEAAVPVVLTVDEENVNRATRLNDIDAYLMQLQGVETSDEEFIAKLSILEERLSSIRSDLDKEMEYESFIAISDEALALGKDAAILIEQSGIQVTLVTAVEAATSTEVVATSTATSSPEINEPEVEVETPAATTSAEVEEETEEAAPEEVVTEEVVTEAEPEPIDEVEVNLSSSTEAQQELDAEI